jgi:hypothetical protein
MPTLTRRRDPDASQETWLINYDDIRVGSISLRAGAPVDKDQGLKCGLVESRRRIDHAMETGP